MNWDSHEGKGMNGESKDVISPINYFVPYDWSSQMIGKFDTILDSQAISISLEHNLHLFLSLESTLGLIYYFIKTTIDIFLNFHGIIS
jgi:hypothetical protein